MEPTLPLEGPAREFWDRHVPRLTEAGILTPADVDAFVVLCLTFEKLAVLSTVHPSKDAFREMIQFNNLQKQFRDYAKQFGIMPQSRKQSKMDVSPPAKKDEFGL